MFSLPCLSCIPRLRPLSLFPSAPLPHPPISRLSCFGLATYIIPHMGLQHFSGQDHVDISSLVRSFAVVLRFQFLDSTGSRALHVARSVSLDEYCESCAEIAVEED